MEISVLCPGILIQSEYGNMSLSTITLIENKEYKMLIDTGGYGQRNALLNVLKSMGITPQEITHVFITHVHWDHIANYDLFPYATFIISEEEIKDLEGKDRRDIATPHQILNIVQSIDKIQVVHDNVEILPFITSILTPGHTKGHMSLLVKINGKNYCIAGDAITDLDSVNNNKPSLAFYNFLDSQNSVSKIKGLSDIIIPGHDFPLIKDESGIWNKNTQTLKI